MSRQHGVHGIFYFSTYEFAYTLGCIAIAVIFSVWFGKMTVRAASVFLPVFGYLLPHFILGFSSDYFMMMIGCFTIGLTMTSGKLLFTTFIQEKTDHNMMATTFGVMTPLLTLCTSIAYAFYGKLLAVHPYRNLLVITGLVMSFLVIFWRWCFAGIQKKYENAID